MIVNYDPKSFIVQAPGRIGREKYCGELVFVEIEEEKFYLCTFIPFRQAALLRTTPL